MTDRYARQICLPEVGEEGQRRLAQARVLLIGAGGLGSPAALYLAAAGVGHIGLIDADRVEASNLQRQILHSDADQGRLKVESGKERLVGLNPEVQVEIVADRFARHNAARLVVHYDVVVDGSDSLATRELAHDLCFLSRKPYIYASVYRFQGQLATFQGRPCYRCLFPQKPAGRLVPSCQEAGVFGVVPGMAGTLQAAEAIKVLLGIGESGAGRLLTFDLLRMDFREVKFGRDPNCRLCGDNPQILEVPTSVQSPEITPKEFYEQWQTGRRPRLVDVRGEDEWEICNLTEYAAELIPLPEFGERFRELDPADDLVLMCRSGVRSAHAQEFLYTQGFTKVQNLTGGILRWSAEVDSSKARY